MITTFSTFAERSGLYGFWIAKEVTSVGIPGIIILVELLIIYRPVSITEGLKMANAVNLGAASALMIVGASLVYIIGHMAREVGFLIAIKVTEAAINETNSPDPHEDSLHGDLPKVSYSIAKIATRPKHSRDITLGCRGPLPTNSFLLDQLTIKYGEADVRRFIESYNTMGNLLSLASNGGKRDSAIAGGHQLTPDTNAFGYAKAWLRSEAPSFGVEKHELSINLAASLILPSILVPVLIGRLSLWDIPATVSATGLAIVVVWWLLRDFHQNRVWERAGAVENMFVVCELRHEKIEFERRAQRSIQSDDGDSLWK